MERCLCRPRTSPYRPRECYKTYAIALADTIAWLRSGTPPPPSPTTTTLRAVSNLLAGERGEVTKGSIELRGERIENLSPADLVKRGVVQVMEGRHCFAHLTIEENLMTGSYTRTSKGEIEANLEKVYNYFPRLKTRRTSQAAYTSGGEQQMCAIGRALMANPSMVLLDEPSMGLAPQIVEEVFNIIKKKNPKFSLVLADCCNNAVNANRFITGPVMRSRPPTMGWESMNCERLFRQAEGNLLVTAARRGELAICAEKTGGFFTHSLVASLDKLLPTVQADVNWLKVIQNAQQATLDMSIKYGCDGKPCRQNPDQKNELSRP